MTNFCASTAMIWKFLGEIIYIVRIVIPIIIVFLGMIDLGKAVMAGEEKTVKEAQKSFFKRLIYGVAVFFVFMIVKVLFGLVGVETDKGDSKICWDCAATPHNKSCLKYIENSDDNDIKDSEQINNK